MCRALGSSRTREKEPCDRVLTLPCGFHTLAELIGSKERGKGSSPEVFEKLFVSLPGTGAFDAVRWKWKRLDQVRWMRDLA